MACTFNGVACGTDVVSSFLSSLISLMVMATGPVRCAFSTTAEEVKAQSNALLSIKMTRPQHTTPPHQSCIKLIINTEHQNIHA